MKESLSGRVGRIVSGSINALVNAVENAAPEVVMEEAIREIDGAIDEVRTELGRQVAARHLAGKRLQEERLSHEALAAQIATAVDAGRDDLAEAGIARQLDIEAQLPVLERAMAEASDKEQELEGYVQALLGRKREMREELRRLASVREEAVALMPGAAGATGSGNNTASRVARAEAAFDRIMEQQSGLAAGRSSVEAGSAAKLAELEELSRQNRIRERLAAVKAKPGQP